MHETKNLCYCTCLKYTYAYVGKASGTAATKGYDFRMGKVAQATGADKLGPPTNIPRQEDHSRP